MHQFKDCRYKTIGNGAVKLSPEAVENETYTCSSEGEWGYTLGEVKKTSKRRQRMNFVSFQEELCKGCKLCINACPQKIIEQAGHFNSIGYHPAAVKLQEKCKSCAFCAMVCPDVVITVTRESNA